MYSSNYLSMTSYRSVSVCSEVIKKHRTKKNVFLSDFFLDLILKIVQDTDQVQLDQEFVKEVSECA